VWCSGCGPGIVELPSGQNRLVAERSTDTITSTGELVRDRGTQSGNAVGEYIGEDPVFGMGAVMPSRTMWCRCGVGVDVVGVVYVPVLALSIIDI
jgi:hypothetical protein